MMLLKLIKATSQRRQVSAFSEVAENYPRNRLLQHKLCSFSSSENKEKEIEETKDQAKKEEQTGSPKTLMDKIDPYLRLARV